LGVEFLFGIEVFQILETEKNVQIVTKNFKIRTEKVVIATNAFTKNLLPEIDVVPARGQILLTEPIKI
jgi:glycine/D-amino acid oxidase-like deaminating enzyme